MGECWDSMDGKGWSCSLPLLLLTLPARALSGAAWPACSAGFSLPLPGHLGCRVVSLGRIEGLLALAACSQCPPQCPPVPAAHLPRGAANPSAHPAESKIHERQIIRGRLSSSLPLTYGSARTWKYSFQVSLCIYVTQTNSFLERATLSHLDT